MSDFYYTRNPGVTVAVFQELIRYFTCSITFANLLNVVLLIYILFVNSRDGLKAALAGRKGKPLMRVLRFLIKHLRKPRFMRILLQVADALVGKFFFFAKKI